MTPSEQYQAFAFAYDLIGGLKYIYTSYIPAVYGTMVTRYGFPDNEDTVDGLKKAIALKFFGDADIDSEEIRDEAKTWLKSLAFTRIEHYGKVRHKFTDEFQATDKNAILKCYLLYTNAGDDFDNESED